MSDSVGEYLLKKHIQIKAKQLKSTVKRQKKTHHTRESAGDDDYIGSNANLSISILDILEFVNNILWHLTLPNVFAKNIDVT